MVEIHESLPSGVPVSYTLCGNPCAFLTLAYYTYILCVWLFSFSPLIHYIKLKYVYIYVCIYAHLNLTLESYCVLPLDTSGGKKYKTGDNALYTAHFYSPILLPPSDNSN